ncbi:MAG: histidine phosphatase family protein [Acetobacteraceae bacterium]
MQRYLILIRHAKASQNFGCPDPDRALSIKGEAQARSVAKWVRPFLDADCYHLQFIVSPALRTKQTAQALFQRLGCGENCIYEPALYQTDEDGIWRLINEVGDAPSHLVSSGITRPWAASCAVSHDI